MNKVILSGRLTREPEIRYSTGESGVMIARYTIAVGRKYDRERQSADFISCVAFGRAAERYAWDHTKRLQEISERMSGQNKAKEPKK